MSVCLHYFFFIDTATTEIYTSCHTLSLHDALPISVGIGLLVGGIEIAGNEAAFLPFVDEAGELACWPAFLVEPFGLDQLLENAELVVGIEDGEIALQADQFGVAAEHLRRDAVKDRKSTRLNSSH